jgi:hypothetical protein
MAEMPYSKDVVDIMTSVLLTAAKIQTQAGRLGFEMVNIGTTTNITEIRRYLCCVITAYSRADYE